LLWAKQSGEGRVLVQNGGASSLQRKVSRVLVWAASKSRDWGVENPGTSCCAGAPLRCRSGHGAL